MRRHQFRRGWRRITTSVTVVCALALGLVGVAATPAAAAGESTDLVFLVDGSGSISAIDWQIQKDGLSVALQDEVAFPRDGSVAVAVVQWSFVSDTEQTRVEVPLTVLDSPATVGTVVNQIQAMSQLGSLTNPGDAVRAGTDLLLADGEDPAATDWILCLSTDGITNSGEVLGSAASYAMANNVDRFTVVGIEDPGVATAADLINHYGPHVFGGGTVTIARNSAEFGNLVIGGCLGGEVELRALEVNQAVQDWQNSVALVAGKATAVRAFVQVPAGADDQRVVGRLFGRRGGADLPGSPLLAINPGGALVAEEDVESRRGDLTDSLNFQLPASWRSGTVELEFEAAGAAVDCQEPAGPGADPAGDCVVTVTFEDEVIPEVVFVGVRYTDGGTTFEPSTAELFEQMFRFRSILPVADIDHRMDTMGNYTGVPDLDDVNSDLAIKRFLDIFLCVFGCTDPTTTRSRYYGVLDGNGGGLANGIPGAVSSGFLSGTGARGDTGYARNRGPHELAHSLGRHHAVDPTLGTNANGRLMGYCNEVASTAAPGHTPFEVVGGNTRPTLGPLSAGVDNEIWGLDNRMLHVNSNLAVVDPRVTFELMSYCGGGPQGRWISQFTYTGLRGAFPAAAVDGAADGATTLQSTDPADFLLVTGTIDFEADIAQVGPVLAGTGNPPAPVPGDYRVQLLDADGLELAGADFTPEEMDADAEQPETETGPPVGLIAVPLPVPAQPVASVVVLHNGSPIGSLAASATAPEIEVVSPSGGETFSGPQVTFAWASSDADGDPLLHTVLYSADDGDTWRALEVNTTATSLTVPRWALAASATARLRVIVSDGVNVASATSSQFAVANNGPLVAIDNPGDDAVFTSVQNIEFVGAGFDPEDGALAGGSLTWSSDLDGPLGTGSELGVNAIELTEGTHEITLTGVDGEGATGTASITIHVFRVAPPPVIPVEVDVRPGSDGPAPINTRSQGVVPVAILTTAEFDAAAVDPATVCFGAADNPAGAGACEEARGTGHLEDVNGDGLPDLVLHYRIQETGIQPGDTLACLVGATYDALAIAGCDEIRAF